MSGVAPVAEALLSDGSLIDCAGIAHQKHGPMRKRAEQRPEFIARQGAADGPLINRIHDSVQEVIIPVVVANESTHGARPR